MLELCHFVFYFYLFPLFLSPSFGLFEHLLEFYFDVLMFLCVLFCIVFWVVAAVIATYVYVQPTGIVLLLWSELLKTYFHLASFNLPS